MPKLSDKKITVLDLDKLSVEERTETLKPIVEANLEPFRQLANTIAETTNFAKSIGIIASSVKLPIADLVNNFQIPKLPQLPVYEPPDLSDIYFERYDPPVTIKKSEWELEQESKQAYLTDLHIQLLEAQLAIAKGAQAPQYDINTGVIKFMGKEIEIPLNTNLEMVARAVLKNSTNMKRKWSWDEIVQANREFPENFTARQIYNASRSINDKVAIETQVKDFLIVKTKSLQLNPKFLAK